MSELIEKMDVYNILKDMICFVRRDVLLNAYDTLKNLPTVKPASQWHRVEEPPKEEGKYLVSDGRGNYFVVWWGPRLGWCYDPKFFCYWMPIEPPKEDEHGN